MTGALPDGLRPDVRPGTDRGVKAVQEAARSSVPSMGYGVAYAVGNVLLAIWGTVIVALLA